MKTTSFNKIHAPEADYLYTGISQLPNAGNGLYTAIPIYKDEMIAAFKGNILTDAQAKQQAAKRKDRYFINLPDGTIMDSMPVKCFAKFANDTEGILGALFKNNAKIALDDNDQVGIIALRNIKAGEEVFCAYGKRYWKKIGL